MSVQGWVYSQRRSFGCMVQQRNRIVIFWKLALSHETPMADRDDSAYGFQQEGLEVQLAEP